MKQFHIIGGQAFCTMAALFLSLSPLFHGLHLASHHHPHRFCNPIHSGCALFVHFCCHNHERDSGPKESQGVAICNSQVNEGYAHDPSTCPICQIFAQLIKGQLLPFSQVDITPQKIQLKEPKHDQAFTDRHSFLSGYPRAPPAC